MKKQVQANFSRVKLNGSTLTPAVDMHKLVPTPVSMGLGHFTALSCSQASLISSAIRHWINHCGHQKRLWSLLSISHAPSRLVAPQPLPQLWRCPLRRTGVESHLKSFLVATAPAHGQGPGPAVLLAPLPHTFFGHLRFPGLQRGIGGEEGKLPPTCSVPKPPKDCEQAVRSPCPVHFYLVQGWLPLKMTGPTL